MHKARDIAEVYRPRRRTWLFAKMDEEIGLY